MSNSKLTITIGLVAVLAALNGCAGKARFPSYYVLNIPAAPVVATKSKPVLGAAAVRELAAPGFLRKGPIAFRQSPEQLDFYNYHLWAVDPRREATDALVREMRSLGLFQSVDIFDGRGTPAYLVSGTLDHLEEVDQDKNVSVQVGISARLIDVRTGDVLWQDASSRTPKLVQRSVPGIVAEMSLELGKAVEYLGSSMHDRLWRRPEEK